MKSSIIRYYSVSTYIPPKTRSVASQLEKNVYFWPFFRILGPFSLNHEYCHFKKLYSQKAGTPPRRLKLGTHAPQVQVYKMCHQFWDILFSFSDFHFRMTYLAPKWLKIGPKIWKMAKNVHFPPAMKSLTWFQVECMQAHYNI